MNGYVLSLIIVALDLLSRSALAEGEAIDLGWIAGHWCGSSGDERIEEHWLPPHGGIVLGLARTMKDTRTIGYEYTRIVLDDGVPVFIAQLGGAAPTAFERTAGGEDWARFENPAHDFPKRVEYRRQGDALHAEIAGTGQDGKEVVISFDYVRCSS
jgi:hypothetical protein